MTFSNRKEIALCPRREDSDKCRVTLRLRSGLPSGEQAKTPFAAHSLPALGIHAGKTGLQGELRLPDLSARVSGAAQSLLLCD